MNTEHTQGEWMVSKTVNDFTIYAADTNKDVALVYKHSRSIPDEQAEANAKLISAAPDLLEALTSLYTKFKNEGLGADKWYGPTMEAARQAVQKATV